MNSIITEFYNTKTIIFLLSTVLITGCATYYQVLPSRMTQLSVGMSKSDVKNLLDEKNEKSNFWFSLFYNNKKYECINYNVISTYNSYSLIFVDNRLILILPESLVKNIWCELVDKNADLPFKSGFMQFIGMIFSNKIDFTNIDFFETNHEKKLENEKLKSELIGYGVGCLPVYAVFVPIIAPYAFYEKQKTENFIKKANSLTLGCEKDEIAKILGKPFIVLKDTDSDYEIWAYKQMRYCVAGIRDEHLEWIGEYSNIIKYFDERGIHY